MPDEDGEELQFGGIDDQGNPIIAEADETKMGKRKCYKGRLVRANWVIGMVERTPQQRCASAVVEKQDASVCVAVTRKHIKPGSQTHSDEWAGCNPAPRMEGHDCTHRKVKHKKEFVNTTDGFRTHTQTTEGTNRAIKCKIPAHKRNGADPQDCPFEFMWRMANAGKLWSALLKGLATARHQAQELLRVDEVEDPWEPTDVLINVDDCEDCCSSDTDTDSED